jgi:hypothetical protein
MVKESKLYDSLGTFASDIPLHRLALLDSGYARARGARVGT